MAHHDPAQRRDGGLWRATDFNFAWSAIFFGLHKTGAAFLEILVLDLAVLVTALLFFRRDRLAGLLFLPYLGWSLYASLLAHDLALLNP